MYRWQRPPALQRIIVPTLRAKAGEKIRGDGDKAVRRELIGNRALQLVEPSVRQGGILGGRSASATLAMGASATAYNILLTCEIPLDTRMNMRPKSSSTHCDTVLNRKIGAFNLSLTCYKYFA